MPVRREWLETDGLGGFASGTERLVRTRRYHALLLTATQPPAGRMALVNGLDATVQTPGGSFALSAQRYAPDVTHPDGERWIESFTVGPWPTWCFRLEDGTRVQQEIFVRHGLPLTVVRWRLLAPIVQVTLTVRPFLSGRDTHSLHHENGAFRFDSQTDGERVTWRPYADLPAVVACSNGTYAQGTAWYRNFLYEEERARGLDFLEDLASPGEFRFALSEGESVLILAARNEQTLAALASAAARPLAAELAHAERRRRESFPTPLHRAADDYIVARGAGRTIVAGYPWFTDWGRDTFIAMRGLTLATGRLRDAREILLAWADAVSEGMLPNRFVEQGGTPEFNAVDASLWYVIAVHDFLEAHKRPRPARRFDALKAARNDLLTAADRARLVTAVERILEGFARGTRFNIHMDGDGLLAAGQPGVQLTWMDAKIGDWVVTPRIGKPVEVQALWLNALRIGATLSGSAERAQRWQERYALGLRSLHERFWNEATTCLFDVIDVDHRSGTVDATVRPNQILAVGGLPFALLEGERARRVVDVVEQRLWTPMGLRSLAPGESGYAPHYEGDMRARDAAYHQGTVWPWLAGPFVEAWLRVRGTTPAAIQEARARFVEPLLAQLGMAGLGHLPEIADAEPPHTPRGCLFQAWSVGELARLALDVLAPDALVPGTGGGPPAEAAGTGRGGAHPSSAPPAALPVVGPLSRGAPAE